MAIVIRVRRKIFGRRTCARKDFAVFQKGNAPWRGQLPFHRSHLDTVHFGAPCRDVGVRSRRPSIALKANPKVKCCLAGDARGRSCTAGLPRRPTPAGGVLATSLFSMEGTVVKCEKYLQHRRQKSYEGTFKSVHSFVSVKSATKIQRKAHEVKSRTIITDRNR